jgi:2',3'-cyclic-nucleotide 2'-phosphodiesterase (5'-nucleotidase family)
MNVRPELLVLRKDCRSARFIPLARHAHHDRMPRLLHYSDVENVYDDADRAGRLAGCLRTLDAEDAVVCGTGDNTAPGVLALVERGRQALDFFAAAGADADTFGNHDFDFGPDETRALVADAPAGQTWVSANVRDEDGDPFGAEAGVVPWTRVETSDGTVGLFGLTDPATHSLNPHAAALSFTDPVAAAERAVDALADCDHVVCLSHLGIGDDRIAALDVDVVLGGHVHARRADVVDGTLCTRPGANGRVVYEVVLDGDGPRAVRHDPSDYPPYEPLAESLRGRVAAAGLGETVARVDDPIPRDEATVHAGECRIGNFVADAYRTHLDADVGLANTGGIRSGPPLVDEVTVADCISVVPFEEPVVLAEVTGAKLLDAFRQGAGSVVDFGEPDWWHAHVSNAELVWDRGTERLTSAGVGGDAVDPEATYTVALASYLLHSDHEFAAIDERHRAAEGDIQHDVLVDHARAGGLDVGVEGRVRFVGGE